MRIPDDEKLRGARVLDIGATDDGLTSFAPEITRPRRGFETKRASEMQDALADFEPAQLSIQPPRDIWQIAARSIGLVAFGAVAWVTLAVMNSSDSPVQTPPAESQLIQADRSSSESPTLATQSTIGGPDLTSVRDSTPAQRVQVVSSRAAPVVAVKTEPRRAPVAAAFDRGSAEAAATAILPSPVPTTGITAFETSAPSRIVSLIDASSAPAVLPAPVSSPSPVVAPLPPPPAAAPAATARVVSARAAVEAVLGLYASAFSAMDARSAKAVWPSVNEKNLERAFDSLEQQEFDLGTCDITVLPPRALALCDGTARYTPKVGNRKARTESRRWTFNLRQTGQEWAIERVDLR